MPTVSWMRFPGSELVTYRASAASRWIELVSSAQKVQPLEHNSFLTWIAVRMDMLSKPFETTNTRRATGYAAGTPATAAADARPYATQIYRGPATEFAGREVAVTGIFPEPSGGRARQLWRALAAYARRLARYTRTEVASLPAPPEGEQIVLYVAGPAARSLVPYRDGRAPLWLLTEDPGTVAAARPFVTGITAAVQRLQSVATDLRTGVDPTALAAVRAEAERIVGAEETAAQPIVAALAEEYETGARNALLGFGGATALGVLGGVLAR